MSKKYALKAIHTNLKYAAGICFFTERFLSVREGQILTFQCIVKSVPRSHWHVLFRVAPPPATMEASLNYHNKRAIMHVGASTGQDFVCTWRKSITSGNSSVGKNENGLGSVCLLVREAHLSL